MLQINNRSGTKVIDLIPGQYRDGDVIVGKHIPISAAAIPAFLTRFERAYNPNDYLRLVRLLLLLLPITVCSGYILFMMVTVESVAYFPTAT